MFKVDLLNKELVRTHESERIIINLVTENRISENNRYFIEKLLDQVGSCLTRLYSLLEIHMNDEDDGDEDDDDGDEEDIPQKKKKIGTKEDDDDHKENEVINLASVRKIA